MQQKCTINRNNVVLVTNFGKIKTMYKKRLHFICRWMQSQQTVLNID